MIDFEKDQREDLDGANDANKLSDQVVKLQELEAELLIKEQELKNELDSTLKEIKLEVAENGKSIARLQTQVEGLVLRIS